MYAGPKPEEPPPGWRDAPSDFRIGINPFACVPALPFPLPLTSPGACAMRSVKYLPPITIGFGSGLVLSPTNSLEPKFPLVPGAIVTASSP